MVYGALRVGLFAAAGALPVLTISAHTFGILSLADSARFLVVPTAVAAVVLCLLKVPETAVVWHGLLAGLAGVLAYDPTWATDLV